MKKKPANIKRAGKAVLLIFLSFQLLFLNSFTLYISCSGECCHKEKIEAPVKKCCSMKHEAKPKQSCCMNTKGSSNSINRYCNCFHASKPYENYLVEVQYKITSPTIDLCNFIPPVSPGQFVSDITRIHQEIKTNSPPIYITTSTLII